MISKRTVSTMLALAAFTLFTASTATAQLVPNFDHLKCYKVKDFAQKKQYAVDLLPEQHPPFNLEANCKLIVPAKLFCIDVIKQNVKPPPPGAPPGKKAGDYLCYKLACPKQQLPMLVITDQFGARDVQIQPPKFLCAPATKQLFNPTPTPTRTPTPVQPTSTPTATRTPGCDFIPGTSMCGGPCPPNSVGTPQQCVFVTDPATGVSDCECQPPNPSCHPFGTNTCTGGCPDPRDKCSNVGPAGALDCECHHGCQPDHTAAPQCSGDCNTPGDVCVVNTAAGACDCHPPTAPPCGNATAPQCDGGCPNAGEACVPGGPSGCFCENGTPPPCGQLAGNPQCLGACPANLACVAVGPVPGGTCSCQ